MPSQPDTGRDLPKRRVIAALLLVAVVVSSVGSVVVSAQEETQTPTPTPEETAPEEEESSSSEERPPSPVPPGAIPDELNTALDASCPPGITSFELKADECYYGVSGDAVIQMWSRDEEGENTDFDEIEDGMPTDFNPENAKSPSELDSEDATTWTLEAARAGDGTFAISPSHPSKWNMYNWRYFGNSFSTNTSVSQHPNGADLESEGYIQDAHATLFRVHNATTAYQSEGETVRYVPTEGAVRGLVDYRIPTEPDIDEEANEMTRYSIASSGITQTCVISGSGEDCDSSNVIGSSAGRYVNFIEYARQDYSKTEFTFAAHIQAQVLVIDYERDCKDCEWKEVGREMVSDEITVSDSVSVDSIRLSADVSRAVYPNGEVEFQFDFHDENGDDLGPTSWAAINVKNSQSRPITSEYHFMTWRKTGWNTMQVTGEKSGSYHPIAAPVTINAIPMTDASAGGAASANQILQENESDPLSNPAPNIPENVNFSAINNGSEWRATGDLLIRHRLSPSAATDEESDYQPSDATIEDIAVATFPYSQPVEIQQVQNRRIQPTNLVASVENSEGDTFTLHVKLTSDSEPVSLQGENRGVIVVGGHEIRTDEDGSASIQLPDSMAGGLNVRYEPTPWYELAPIKPAFAGSEQYIYRSGNNLGVGFFGYIFDRMFLPVVFLGALYYVSKKIPGIDEL